MADKQQVNIEKCFQKGVKPEVDHEYLLKIDDDMFVVDEPETTGKNLMELIGKSSEDFFLLMRVRGGKKLLKSDDEVNLIQDGIEKFFTVPKSDEVVDVEECFKKGIVPIITWKYIIRINKEKVTIEQPSLTGKEILALVGKTPESAFLRQKTKGGRNLVEADERVDFTECGIERFITQDRSCTEGFVAKRDFALPEEDVKFLEGLGKKWSTVKDGNHRWLVIRDYRIPEGYNVSKADVALLIKPSYPVAPLDMIWFFPALQRADGKAINALTTQLIEAKNYQRWSRHRNGLNAWEPGVDNVESQLQLMMANLELEFKKR